MRGIATLAVFVALTAPAAGACPSYVHEGARVTFGIPTEEMATIEADGRIETCFVDDVHQSADDPLINELDCGYGPERAVFSEEPPNDWPEQMVFRDQTFLRQCD